MGVACQAFVGISLVDKFSYDSRRKLPCLPCHDRTASSYLDMLDTIGDATYFGDATLLWGCYVLWGR